MAAVPFMCLVRTFAIAPPIGYHTPPVPPVEIDNAMSCACPGEPKAMPSAAATTAIARMTPSS